MKLKNVKEKVCEKCPSEAYGCEKSLIDLPNGYWFDAYTGTVYTCSNPNNCVPQ